MLKFVLVHPHTKFVLGMSVVREVLGNQVSVTKMILIALLKTNNQQHHRMDISVWCSSSCVMLLTVVCDWQKGRPELYHCRSRRQKKALVTLSDDLFHDYFWQLMHKV